MDGHAPAVWISDRNGTWQNRGARQQTCLAHPDRDAEFAFEHGSDDLPTRFKLRLDKAFELARNLGDLVASTFPAKKRKLEKRLAKTLRTPTVCGLAAKSQAKIGRAKAQLLTFCDYPGQVEPTINGSERPLRLGVVQRKVANGYRAMWAAEADVRMTIDTGRPRGSSPFQTILNMLVGTPAPAITAQPP